MSTHLLETLDLPLVDNGDIMLHACLELHFFFRAATEDEDNEEIPEPLPFIEVAAGCIFREHRAFLERLGLHYHFYCNPQTLQWKNIENKEHNFTPDIWLRMNPAGANYFIHYHTGQQADDATDSHFIMSMKRSSVIFKHNQNRQDNSLSYLAVAVPLSVISSQALFDEYMQLVKKWTEQLSPLHGYLGINLTANDYRHEEMQPMEYMLTQKLPGLDFYNRSRLCVDFGTNRTHIKGISWLTIIHKDLLSLAGLADKDDIESACPEARIISLENNVIFQAAAMPELLDLSSGYHQIAEYLEPIRFQALKSPHSNYSQLANQSVYDDASYQAWLSRFTV